MCLKLLHGHPYVLKSFGTIHIRGGKNLVWAIFFSTAYFSTFLCVNMGLSRYEDFFLKNHPTQSTSLFKCSALSIRSLKFSAFKLR